MGKIRKLRPERQSARSTRLVAQHPNDNTSTPSQMLQFAVQSTEKMASPVAMLLLTDDRWRAVGELLKR